MISPATKLKAIKSRQLDEQRHEAILSCGMRLIFAPRPGFEKRIAYVVADFGSINTHWRQDGQDVSVPGGIAHFLEHQLFKKAAGDLTDQFSQRGAYCNAHTSHTQTAYYFECVQHFEQNLHTLMELALTPHFERGLVDTERDIIIQEINQYRDNPGWVGYQQLLESLYVNHPLRVDIAGTEAMVRAIGPEQLQTCHAAFYHPSNMYLIVCADMKPQDVLRLAEKAAARFAPATPAPRVERLLPAEPPVTARAATERRMFVARPRLLMGFKDPAGLQGAELASQDLVSSIAMDALFSKEGQAYERLYSAGLIGNDFGAGYQAERGFGYAVLGGETSNPEALLRELQAVLDSARKTGVAADVVERKRRKFVGAFLRYFNDPESTAYAYLGALSQGSELFDVPRLAAEITVEQVNARIQEMFHPQRQSVSIVRPQA